MAKNEAPAGNEAPAARAAAAKKKALRIQVEFWQAAEEERVYTGYTTNVSASGLFLACHSPLARGTSVLMRIKAERDLLVGGTVTRVVKVPLQFRRIRTSGMGVQFDNPSDPVVQQVAEMGKELSADIKY